MIYSINTVDYAAFTVKRRERVTIMALYKFTQAACPKTVFVSTRTFNVLKSKQFFTASVTKNQVICKMTTEVPLSPPVIWENLKFLQRNEADPILKLLLNGTSFFRDFCDFISTIRKNKYDSKLLLLPG